ncbi:MAG: alpha/beta hydrolase [Pseudomonadota bacterium]
MTPFLQKQHSTGGIAFHRSGKQHSDLTLVLIHGVGLRAESWYPQISELQNSFDLLAPDLPGHGDSLDLAAGFEYVTLQHYTESLLAFIEETTQKPLILCGHSLGALICVELAAKLKGQINGLIALNTVFDRTPDARAAVRERAATQYAADSIIGIEQTLERWFGRTPDSRNKVLADQCEHWLRDNSVEGYAKAYKAFADQTGVSRPTLQQIDCPCVFMTGALDPNSTSAMSEELARTMNEASPLPVFPARSRIIDDAGHMLPLSHADEVVDELKMLVHTISAVPMNEASA